MKWYHYAGIAVVVLYLITRGGNNPSGKALGVGAPKEAEAMPDRQSPMARMGFGVKGYDRTSVSTQETVRESKNTIFRPPSSAVLRFGSQSGGASLVIPNAMGFGPPG